MFTVKLTKCAFDADGKRVPGCFQTRLIETSKVDVHISKPGELFEIETDNNYFYVAQRDAPRPEGYPDEIDFWFEAFIENAAGKTTHVVHF